MCKCWEITEDELLVPEKGGPDSGCECEIFTAILRGLPRPEAWSFLLPACPARLTKPALDVVGLAGQRGGRKGCQRKEWQK